MTTEEMFLRLGTALLLGMIIGFERKLVHKEAGMRTYGILALACSTFMLSAVMIGNNFETEQETWRALASVLANVIVGLGVGVGLGAGLGVGVGAVVGVVVFLGGVVVF
jgi:putative Mg2+ transporter-C (MgtC) family protein